SIGRTRIGLLNTMFSASSSFTWAGVGLPDSRSLRKGCIVIPPMLCDLLLKIEQRLIRSRSQASSMHSYSALKKYSPAAAAWRLIRLCRHGIRIVGFAVGGAAPWHSPFGRLRFARPTYG